MEPKHTIIGGIAWLMFAVTLSLILLVTPPIRQKNTISSSTAPIKSSPVKIFSSRLRPIAKAPATTQSRVKIGGADALVRTMVTIQTNR
jgi:hypothetical protein